MRHEHASLICDFFTLRNNSRIHHRQYLYAVQRAVRLAPPPSLDAADEPELVVRGVVTWCAADATWIQIEITCVVVGAIYRSKTHRMRVVGTRQNTAVEDGRLRPRPAIRPPATPPNQIVCCKLRRVDISQTGGGRSLMTTAPESLYMHHYRYGSVVRQALLLQRDHVARYVSKNSCYVSQGMGVRKGSNSKSYLQGHSTALALRFPIISSIATMPLSCTVNDILLLVSLYLKRSGDITYPVGRNI